MQNEINDGVATAEQEEQRAFDSFVENESNNTQPAGQAETNQAQEDSQNNEEQSVGQSEDIAQAEQSQEQQPNEIDKKMESQEWVKKRLRRQEIAFERKMQEMEMRNHQILQTMVGAQQQQPNGQAPYDPYSVNQNLYAQPQLPNELNPELVDKFIQEKVNKALEEKSVQARRVEEARKVMELKQEADDLKFKYDDFDDALHSMNPYITSEMRQTLTMLPRGGLENLYAVWKESPEEVRKISQLPQGMQTVALAQLDARLSAKKSLNQASQQRQNNASSLSVKTKAVMSNSSINDDYESLVKEYLNKR
jgi:hypothetical protein